MTGFKIEVLALLDALESRIRTLEAALYDAQARAAHFEGRTAAAESALQQLRADQDELFRAHNALAEAFERGQREATGRPSRSAR